MRTWLMWPHVRIQWQHPNAQLAVTPVQEGEYIDSFAAHVACITLCDYEAPLKAH
jgi:hypothetical protein